MKKLIALITMALLANVAMAAPGFDILGDAPIEVPKDGTPVMITIATSGSGTIGGMELYLQTAGSEFEIVGLQAGNIGGFFQTGVNFAGESVLLFPDPDGFLPSAQYAVDFVSTTADIANVAAGSIIAKAMVRAVPGTLVGTTGTLTTDTAASASNFSKGELNGQDTIGLIVVPEPMTALLLLAGLPLLRRRHA